MSNDVRVYIEKVKFISGERKSGKSYELTNLIREQIKKDRTKPIIVSALAVKLGHINDVIYHNAKGLYVAVVHPLDKTVKVVKDGKLTNLTYDEFFKDKFKELTNCVAFVDDCLIGTSRLISERIIKSRRVSEVTLTTSNKDLLKAKTVLFNPVILSTVNVTDVSLRKEDGKFYKSEEDITVSVRFDKSEGEV